MRKIFITCIVIVSICISLISCTRNNSALAEYMQMERERDSLETLADCNRRDLEMMTSFFNEVANCIDSINEQESLLTTRVDMETHRRYSAREISQRLNQLSEIITRQRERISSLADSLAGRVDTIQSAGMRSTIEFLTRQLQEKENQIEALRAEIQGQRANVRRLTAKVDTLSAAVNNLNAENMALTEAVQVQTEIINEGYILIAGKDELKAMGVIQGGGFLRRSKVVLDRVDISKCTRVNISEFNDLSVASSDAKIISPVPQGSYSFSKHGNGKVLTISNSTEFWSLSNVLVIQL